VVYRKKTESSTSRPVFTRLLRPNQRRGDEVVPRVLPEGRLLYTTMGDQDDGNLLLVVQPAVEGIV
jgi:hypothetical protein